MTLQIITAQIIIANAAELIASIPSPGSDGFDLGPLRIRFYSLSIILGVMAGVGLAARRMPNRRFAAEVASELAVPAVLGGFVGSRLYHVVTDSNYGDWYKVWEGGLGIPGGILGGTIAVAITARRRGYPFAPLFDIIAPTLALAQAVGRWGNWFNQELFGGPLSGFLGLEIDPQYRPAGFGDTETFHPTFLYESLWNFALTALILWIDRRKVLKPGRLFYVYMGGYALGRLWIESIRIDPATEILGARVNIWVMGMVLAVSVLGLAINGVRSKGERDPYRRDESSGAGSDARPGADPDADGEDGRDGEDGSDADDGNEFDDEDGEKGDGDDAKDDVDAEDDAGKADHEPSPKARRKGK